MEQEIGLAMDVAVLLSFIVKKVLSTLLAPLQGAAQSQA